MNKICTSLEQSQKLIELGIDINTADMCWTNHLFSSLLSSWRIESTPPQEYKNLLDRFVVRGYLIEPAWSLSALMDLPPKDEDINIDLCFGGYKGDEYIDEWFCSFEDNKEPFEFHSCSNKDKLDAVFEMIVWLKENGKI